MANHLEPPLLKCSVCRPVCVLTFLMVFSGSTVDAQTPFASPEDKLRVLAPLVAERVSGAPVTFRLRESGIRPVRERPGRSVLERVAWASEIDPARLQLWLELLLGHGREGLLSLTDANAVELAKQVQGTWSMADRYIGETRSRVRTRMYNDIIEMRAGQAKIRTLTVEAGNLDLGSPPDSQGSDEFILGAYGTITHEDVSGAAYGLAEGEKAVLQIFEGELIGINFPGLPARGAAVTIEALWVRQGNVYRTVTFQQSWRGTTDTTPHLLEPGDTPITAWGDRYTLGYTNFNSVETYQRLSREVMIEDMEDVWRRASRDPRALESAIGGVCPIELNEAEGPFR